MSEVKKDYENLQQKIDEEKVNLDKELKDAIDVVLNFGVQSNMDRALTFETFKARVKNELSRKDNLANKQDYGTMLMGDFDNLSKYNMAYGERETDIIISKMIRQVRNTLAKQGIERYDLGKLGDEIYIYIPDKNSKANLQELVKKLNSVKVKNIEKSGKMEKLSKAKIGASFGSSILSDSNLEQAISNTERQMMKIKQVKKTNALKKDAKKLKTRDDIEEYLIGVIDSKLRIDEKILAPIQLQEYRKNIKEALRSEYANIKSERKSEQDNNEDKETLPSLLELDIENVKDEFRRKYPDITIPDKDLEVLAISSTLQHTPIQGVDKLNQYFASYYQKIDSTPKKEIVKDLLNTKLMSIELGKIKYINDKYGHTACDARIYDLIKEISNAAKLCNINMKNNLLSNRISTYYMIMDSSTDANSIADFKKNLANLEKKFEFTINTSSARQLISDDPNEKEIYQKKYLEGDINGLFKTAFDRAAMLDGKEIEIINNDKKIHDKGIIANVTRKVLKSYVKAVKEMKVENKIDSKEL